MEFLSKSYYDQVRIRNKLDRQETGIDSRALREARSMGIYDEGRDAANNAMRGGGVNTFLKLGEESRQQGQTRLQGAAMNRADTLRDQNLRAQQSNQGAINQIQGQKVGVEASAMQAQNQLLGDVGDVGAYVATSALDSYFGGNGMSPEKRAEKGLADAGKLTVQYQGTEQMPTAQPSYGLPYQDPFNSGPRPRNRRYAQQGGSMQNQNLGHRGFLGVYENLNNPE